MVRSGGPTFRKVYPEVYRILSSVYLFLCLAIIGFCATAEGATVGEVDSSYLEQLQRSAREKRLHEARDWEVLLHYQPSGSGKVSLVDDPRFFFAPDGSKNPQSELSATLAAFFASETGPAKEPARCRFVARYAWLKEQLAIDDARLPSIACPDFDRALADVNPRSVVLVFPSTLNNSPSSMFGHTLIRINTSYKNELLAHAVNYAATATDTLGILYAFKGIFGFYQGYYSNLPYYVKVQEYNDMEFRDIWEYHLNLTSQEAYRMFLHIWELKDIYSDYYFFDENCSFELLYLLEAARPSLRLTGAFYGKLHFWVIPSDTIRIVAENGLVEKVTYRPSRATRMQAMVSTMDRELQAVSFRIADNTLEPGSVLTQGRPVEQERAALDLAAELTQYRFAQKKLDKEEYTKRFLRILSARSTLGTPGDDPYAVRTPVPPDEGHRTGRFSTGGGYRAESWFSELKWRAAYHDLLDDDDGYVPGAQINFMDVSGRYYVRDDKLSVRSARLIDIASLSPWNGIFHPISWKVSTGIEEKVLADGEERPVYFLNAGAGVTARTGSAAAAYLLGEFETEGSRRFEDHYAPGVGGSAGILATVAGPWKVHVWSQGLFFPWREEHRRIALSLDQNIALSTNVGIRLSATREKSWGYYRNDLSFGLNLYY